MVSHTKLIRLYLPYMEDVEMNNVEKFIKERIMENKKLFNKDEIDFIRKHENLMKKIYLLGFINSKECYKN